MPKKIRELKQILRKAGFIEAPGKGSHTKWSHPLLAKIVVVISGKNSKDAKPYQESLVANALKQLSSLEGEEE